MQVRYGVSGKPSAIHTALNLDSIPVLENTVVCLLVPRHLKGPEQEWSSDTLIAGRVDAYRLESCTTAPCGH
jgi:hypothetical protein